MSTTPNSTIYFGNPDGVWTTWTPVFTDLTIGTGGVVIAEKCQIGKICHIYLQITFGTSPVLSTTPSISGFPTMAYARAGAVWKGSMIDVPSGGIVYQINGFSTTATSVEIRYGQVSGSDVGYVKITGTNPIPTLESTDVLILNAVYETV